MESIRRRACALFTSAVILCSTSGCLLEEIGFDQGGVDPSGGGTPIFGPGIVAVLTDVLGVGTSGVAFSAPINAAGGKPPYLFLVVEGDLPPGLALDATTGEVSGVPTAEGQFTFVVRVEDSNEEPLSATKQFTVTVMEPGQTSVEIAQGGAASAAASLGLVPGLHALQARGAGADRVEPFDWAAVDFAASLASGIRTGDLTADSLGFVDLIRSQAGGRGSDKTHWYLVTELNGWLWVERAGDLTLRLAEANDSARVFLGGQQVLANRGETATIAGVARGFHALRIVHKNHGYDLELRLEAREEGETAFSLIPASRLYCGPVVEDAPLLTKTAVQGMPFSYQLPLRGVYGTPSVQIVAGALPAGLSLDLGGRIHGTPSEAGTHYFGIELKSANGLRSVRWLGLHVIRGLSASSRNDADEFLLTFEEQSLSPAPGIQFPSTALTGGSVLGLGNGDMHMKPRFGAAGDLVRLDRDVGAIGSSGSVAMPANEVGFYVTGAQNEHLSDYFPAVRNANRFAVMFRMPDYALRPSGEFRWSEDPNSFATSVLGSLVCAGHNVTRWAGHEKEERNWHFYHKINPYWNDEWQCAMLRYLGDGWYYFEMSDQVTSQRTGPGQQAAFYNPIEDYERGYFETLSRMYFSVDDGWGATANSYEDRVFRYDNLRYWRLEPQVKITTRDGKSTFRRVISSATSTLDMPFLVTYSGDEPMAYRVSRWGGKTPSFGGAGVFVDENGNGTVDAGEPELGATTPVFQPGTSRAFVYRVGTSGLELDATRTFGVNLRAKDPADVFTFDGDSMQFLVFKASRSGARVENIQVDAGSGVYSSPNQPPAVSITVAPTSGLTGQELEFRGLASDADGPKTPRPYWDFGDATPYVFGTDVQHVYAKPGTYTVRFYASDSVRRSVAETTVLVE